MYERGARRTSAGRSARARGRCSSGGAAYVRGSAVYERRSRSTSARQSAGLSPAPNPPSASSPCRAACTSATRPPRKRIRDRPTSSRGPRTSRPTPRNGVGRGRPRPGTAVNETLRLIPPAAWRRRRRADSRRSCEIRTLPGDIAGCTLDSPRRARQATPAIDPPQATPSVRRNRPARSFTAVSRETTR